MQKEFNDDLIHNCKTGNLTIMNTIYHKPIKIETGKSSVFTKPQIDIVYKNNTTGKKESRL